MVSSIRRQIHYQSRTIEPRTWHVRTLNRYSPWPVIYINTYVTTVCRTSHQLCAVRHHCVCRTPQLCVLDLTYLRTVCAVPYVPHNYVSELQYNITTDCVIWSLGGTSIWSLAQYHPETIRSCPYRQLYNNTHHGSYIINLKQYHYSTPCRPIHETL